MEITVEKTETAWEGKGLKAWEEREWMQGEEWYLHHCVIPYHQETTQLHVQAAQIFVLLLYIVSLITPDLMGYVRKNSIAYAH